MLDSTPYGFALELAVAASRREYLDLQQWLSDRFRLLALPFFQVGKQNKHVASQTSLHKWYEAELWTSPCHLAFCTWCQSLMY